MAIAIEELVKDLSREEILEDLLTIAKVLGLSTSAWQPGEPVWVLLTTMAEQLSKLWNNVIVKAIRAGFLDYAEGDWLTLLAWTLYGVYRKEATFGTGLITVENRAGGFYNLVPGDIRVVNAAGKTFTNVTGGTLASWTGSGPYTTVELTFRADEAGSESSTPIGGILVYPAPPAAGPAGVYARANVAPIIGAAVEPDDELKDRCRLSTGVLSPAGAKSAAAFVARSTKRPDGTYIDCSRVRVIDNGLGVVGVWLASPTGPTPGDLLTDGSDVYLANVAIQEKVCPVGLVYVVQGAIVKSITVGITVYVDRDSNVTAAEAQAAAGAAVSEHFAKMKIGGNTIVDGALLGYVFRETLVAVATKASPGIFRADVLLDSGTADVGMQPYWVAVPTITVNAIVVSQ